MMASITGSNIRQETGLFSYGSHEIDLGNPRLHRLNMRERKLTVYSDGGMGLQKSPFYPVVFQFEANQVSELVKLEGRITTIVPPRPWVSYTKSNDSSPQQAEKKTPVTTPLLNGEKTYRITTTQIFKKISIPQKPTEEAKEITYISGYEDLTTPTKIDLIKLVQIKGRLSSLLEKRKDLKELFLPFIEQLNSLIKPNRHPTTFVDLEILDNKLEIVVLKKILTADQWHAFKNYLWGGNESGASVLLSIPEELCKKEL